MKLSALYLGISTLFFTMTVEPAVLQAQSMSKKYRTVKVSRVINAPASRVWEALVLDYGEISNFAPSIYASNYERGSLKGEVGAERKCEFNKKGTRWSHERLVEVDHENMVARNIIIDAGKFPLDKDNSQAYYRVVDNGDGTSTASYEFQFRAKPAFMGFMMKGSFKKQLGDVLVGLEHYVTTGEVVNATTGNWKEVKKKYNS